MSGIGEAGLVLGIISSIISIIDATTQVYEAVEDEVGLPKNFKKSAVKLPLISKLLEDADTYVNHERDAPTKVAFMPILSDSKIQASQLQQLFAKVMPEEGDSRLDRYLRAARTIGKGGRVESLIGGILENLRLLTTTFPEVTKQKGKEQLAKAIEDVSKMEPSLPDGFEAPEFVHHGSGAQNNNTGSGTQNNSQNYGLGHQNIENEVYMPSHIKNEFTPKFPFRRNPDFVFRGDIFAELDKKLPLSSYKSVALWGLGGSGKTQIALEFAYRRCEEASCLVFWVHADSHTGFLRDYKEIANLAGLSRELENEDLMNSVRVWIESQTNWLLVIDNADNLEYFLQGYSSISNSENLSAFLPKGLNGSILWTTRDKGIVGGLVGTKEGINVPNMEWAEAQALLAGLSNCVFTEQDNIAIKELLERLDRLPLAISQAAVYIQKTSTSVVKYVQKLEEEKKRWKLLEQSRPDRHRRPEVSNSVLQTWQISMDYICRQNPCACRILYTVAYFNNQGILFELIKAAARSSGSKRENIEENDEDDQEDDDEGDEGNEEDSEEDDEDEKEDDDVLEATTRLEEFSFLRLRQRNDTTRSYDMHKLVQEATRYAIKRRKTGTEKVYFSKTALGIILQKFPHSAHNTWKQCESLLPHALAVCAWPEVSREKIPISVVLSKVSTYFYDQGRGKEAEKISVKVLQLRKEVLGEKHPDTISSMAELAATYHQQGRAKEAEEIKVEVLQLRKEVLGEKHPDTLYSMASLAATYYQQGRAKEAEEISVEVLQLRKEVLGEKHPDTLYSMASLAATYHQQGRAKEDEEISVEVLQLRKEVLGEKHPDTIRSMAELAATYHQQGRAKEAEEIKVEVLQLRKEVLGEKHPDTISSMAELAATYHQQGRAKEAEEIKVEVLQLRKEVLGEKHPDTISSMASLAATYYQQGRAKEDEEISVEVLQLRKEVLGEKHPDTIRSMAELAATYHQQGRVKEAEEIKVEVLQLQIELLE